MQMFAVIVKVLFASLAASAAKLPLPPSTLYDAPFDSLPVPSVPAAAIQTPAEIPSVPAQLSTLYEAPVEDIPSFAQPSLQVQNAELPSLFDLPTEGFPAPAQQASVIQSQSSVGHIQQSTVNIVPVPDVPSDLYEVPIETLPTSVASVDQPSFIQTTGEIFSATAGPGANVPTHSQHSGFVQHLPVASGPAEPTILNVQFENGPFPNQQVNVLQTPVQVTQGPAEPSVLYEEPIEIISPTVQQPSGVQTPVQVVQGPAEPSVLYEEPIEVISPTVQQPSVVQIPIQLVQVPADPSILYDVPAENFPLSSQTNSFSQAPSAVPHEQAAPANLDDVPVVIVVSDPSSFTSSSTGTQTELFQGDVDLSTNTFSQGSSAPSEPSGLYATPEADFPVQSGPGLLSQSPTDVLLISDEPADFYEAPVSVQVITPEDWYQAPVQSILFPEVVPAEFVPVPAVPSTLYDIPEAAFVGSLGKAMTSDNEIFPSTLYEVPAAASEPVASVVAKGGMMIGMPYDFQWGVQDSESGNAFTHYENSDGQTTSGEYRVTLPDGRIQIVSFYDNGDGFHADITYE